MKFLLARSRYYQLSRHRVRRIRLGAWSRRNARPRRSIRNPGGSSRTLREIWQSQLDCAREALAAAGVTGVAHRSDRHYRTNARRPIVWDRRTGAPVCNAIVWQDRRTADICDRLKAEGLEALFTGRTGLVLDAYFSGTKLRWVLDHVPGARRDAQAGASVFRHGGQLVDLEPHRGTRPRDGREQRLAHAAVQHPHGRLGRQAARV